MTKWLFISKPFETAGKARRRGAYQESFRGLAGLFSYMKSLGGMPLLSL